MRWTARKGKILYNGIGHEAMGTANKCVRCQLKIAVSVDCHIHVLDKEISKNVVETVDI